MLGLSVAPIAVSRTVAGDARTARLDNPGEQHHDRDRQRE